jgi:antitoxin component YwqK of YwqJK toxin-antitoxin module
MRHLTPSFFLIAVMATSSLAAQAEIRLEFTAIHSDRTSPPVYQLLFHRGPQVIAKRVYHNGRTVVAEGKIPRKIDNVIRVHLLKNKPDEKGSNHGTVYIYRGKTIAKRFYKDGKPVSEGEIPDGIFVEYYDDGSMKNIFVHQKGTRNGPALSLYPSGSMRGEATYQDGYPAGILRWYYEKGNVMSESEVIDKRERFHRENYCQGKKKVTKRYDPEGKLLEEMTYGSCE